MCMDESRKFYSNFYVINEVPVTQIFIHVYLHTCTHLHLSTYTHTRVPSQGNLRSWLLDENCFDQCAIIFNGGSQVSICQNTPQEVKLVTDREVRDGVGRGGVKSSEGKENEKWAPVQALPGQPGIFSQKKKRCRKEVIMCRRAQLYM